MAVAVLAALGATALAGCDDPGAAPAAAPGAVSGTVTAVGERAPVRYSPTWLPPAIVERDRAMSADVRLRPGEQAPVHRRWYAADSAEGIPRAGVVMTVSDARFPGRADGNDDECGPDRADINGIPGSVSDTCVQWQPDPESRVTIYASLPDMVVLSRDDLLRVARSVRPDPGELAVPFRVGSIGDLFPGSVVISRQVQGSSPTTWHATVQFGTGDRGVPTVTVDVGTTRHGESRDGTLVVPLDNGLSLTVGGPTGDGSKLRAVADRVAVTGSDVAATVTWVGNRP